MIQVAIIGAAGLSGQELIRILNRHPGAELRVITSSKFAGQALGDVFPEFARTPLTFVKHDAPLDGCDVVFLAVPNQASLEMTPGLLAKGLRVIDLSGVYRLRDVAVFKQYYGLEHTSQDTLAEAIFGLPEAFRGMIPKARLVSNPGCYPTAALLGLLPLGDLAGELSTAPIIDAKSGVSGAGGRVEDDSTNFMEVNENLKAYKLFTHQHGPEIDQYFSDLTTYDLPAHGAVVFTPHLLPIGRGILSTIYLRFKTPQDPADFRRRFAAFAEREPFVVLLPEGQNAEIKMARGGNNCMISLHSNATGTTFVVVTAIDNLTKGASGQAIQNMNLMFDQDETTGLI